MTVEAKSEGAQMPELAEEEARTATEEPIKEEEEEARKATEEPIKEKEEEALKATEEPIKEEEEEALKAIEEPIKDKEEEAKPNSTMVDASEKEEEARPSSTMVDASEKEEDSKPNSIMVEASPNSIMVEASEKEAEAKLNSTMVEASEKEEEAKRNSAILVEASEKGAEPDSSVEEKDDDKKSEEPASDLGEKQPQEDPKSEINSLSDLRDAERKALIELKAMVEEAIVENKLFKSQAESGDDGAKSEGIDNDVSLWGVPLLPSKSSDATDVVLLKFLRARDFKAKESFDMLRSCLQWRKDESIDSIAGEAELGADFAAACYMDGHDREGHPVCYNVPAVFQDEAACKRAFGSEEGRKRFLRWRVQVMERGIERLDLSRPGGVSDLLQVTDLKNSVGPSRKELRDTMKRAVQILQDNYPEFVARNIFVNVPFWYYAFYALLSPFFTQRTKSKFEFARPSQATETLLKYIPAEALPVGFGGFKRENDAEFSVEEAVSELMVKSSSTETIEIPVPGAGTSVTWDLAVVGWDVSYKEEFVPDDEGSYTVVVQKAKKMAPQDETARSSFTNNEPGKIVLTIENKTSKKKRVLYRHKAKSS